MGGEVSMRLDLNSIPTFWKAANPVALIRRRLCHYDASKKCLKFAGKPIRAGGQGSLCSGCESLVLRQPDPVTPRLTYPVILESGMVLDGNGMQKCSSFTANGLADPWETRSKDRDCFVSIIYASD